MQIIFGMGYKFIPLPLKWEVDLIEGMEYIVSEVGHSPREPPSGFKMENRFTFSHFEKFIQNWFSEPKTYSFEKLSNLPKPLKKG